MASHPFLSPHELHIVLDNIRSAFNVGSIFRTADACAATHLHLCGMTAAPPNPRLLRTSLGADATLPWTHYPSAGDALAALREDGIPAFAIEIAADALNFSDFDWPPRLAVVFGHERRGIAPALLAQCAGTIRLPMFGQKNTLNVATAAGVILYDVLRKWEKLGEPPRSPQHGFTPP